MDTSEQYILMCARATEIQKNWIRRYGDYVWKGIDYLMIPAATKILTHLRVLIPPYNDNLIWLPRQDQLQVLVNCENDEETMDVVNWEFYKFAQSYVVPSSGRFKSLEQLWLAFVMKEKFNKVWSGEDWEVIKK